jgi:hypothetical protein
MPIGAKMYEAANSEAEPKADGEAKDEKADKKSGEKSDKKKDTRSTGSGSSKDEPVEGEVVDDDKKDEK